MRSCSPSRPTTRYPRYAGPDFDGGHWWWTSATTMEQGAAPAPGVEPTCAREPRPFSSGSCLAATVREEVATAIFGPGYYVGAFLLDSVIRHPILWSPVLIPILLIGSVLPDRSSCDGMPR